MWRYRVGCTSVEHWCRSHQRSADNKVAIAVFALHNIGQRLQPMKLLDLNIKFYLKHKNKQKHQLKNQ